MAHKKMGQASFVEAFLRPDLGANRRLERIERMIDWAPLERAIRRRASKRWFANFFVPINDRIGVDIIARGDYEATSIDALMAIVPNPEESDLDIGANIGCIRLHFLNI
jgi:hypothetical protein